MTGAQCEIVTKVKINTDLKPPARYSVVYFNDEKTSAAFVVQSLVEVFGYSVDAAIALTKQVDEKGSGVAASGLNKELASHLRDLVKSKAEAEGYPLVVEIKED
jgi:ATP-dependent Clp protease adapter protein ClpS